MIKSFKRDKQKKNNQMNNDSKKKYETLNLNSSTRQTFAGDFLYPRIPVNAKFTANTNPFVNE